jgi:excisionase family DNA binding protein
MDSPLHIISIPEFASLIKVNPRWLYREVQAGRVPCIRIGRAVRIDQDAALEALRVPVMSEVR